jgi:renalase
MVSNKPKLAIVGTGMSGLACADGLGQHFEISLFDKSRGLSGRMSTRRGEAHTFDHGAQYFRARTKLFASWLKPFEGDGHLQPWTPRHFYFGADGGRRANSEGSSKLVFVSGMSAIGKVLLADHPDWKLYLDCMVDLVTGNAGKIFLHCGAERFGPFSHVVLAMPPQQVQALVAPNIAFADALKSTQMIGCHSLMLGYGDQEAPDMDWDCAHFEDAILGFSSVNSTKPGRSSGFALVVQTKHQWSEAHIEDNLDTVGSIMKQRFEEITGIKTDASGYNRVHRWRFASTQSIAASEDIPYLLDEAMGLSAVGDWCRGSKVEDAFLSGSALAAQLVSLLA